MAFEDLHRPLMAAGFRGAIKWLFIVTGVVWVVQRFAGDWMLTWLALTPVAVLRGHLFWQPLTYMFLHGSIIHWLFNMLVLWMFGRVLEDQWGSAFFLRYFLVCGLGSALCVLLLSPHSAVPTIGASGAIFGLLVAFAMVFPEAVIFLYLVVPVKAWQAVAFFAAIEFFTGLEGGGAGMGRFAHLGGMLTGYLYLKSGELYRLKHIQPVSWLRDRIRGLSRARKPVVFHEVTDDLVIQVDKILDKKQVGRMKELSLQQRGADALEDEEIAAALKLTDDQKKALVKVREDSAEKQNEIIKSLTEGGGDQGEIREKVGALRKELNEKAMAVLTSAQKESFEKLKGAKFDLPKGRGFPF